MFSTVRPQDYSVPYSVLEKNSVAFSAVDKRSNKLLTVMVSVSSSSSSSTCVAHAYAAAAVTTCAGM
jgi:hypothetical protein